MSRRGDFFALGKPQWKAACELGMNPAVALLVLARGTGPDNSTTAWSAEAVFNYSGITWRRAKEAISLLCENNLVERVADGSRPRYRITKPEGAEDLLWLPNELIAGAGKEVPPVARLRQGQEIEVLQLFIDLYGEQELTGDGGLPRSLIHQHYERKKIMDFGQFTVYGFIRENDRNCRHRGPLQRFAKRKQGQGTAWDRLTVLEHLGLLEWVPYLAESDDDEAELIHALAGDEHGQSAADAAGALAAELPGGYSYETPNYEYVLPVINHMPKAAVVGVCRLRYRPKTSRTAAWYGQHINSCRRFVDLYSRLARGEFKQAV